MRGQADEMQTRKPTIKANQQQPTPTSKPSSAKQLGKPPANPNNLCL
jgi:hypothetical protein